MIKWQELDNVVLHQLNKTWKLLNKTNILIAKMENPYLLTYLLESIDSISSNEIEDIHTTVDEAAEDIIIKNHMSPYVRYRETLKQAHKRLLLSEIILIKDIKFINKSIRGIDSGFRKIPNTIKNNKGDVILKGADAQKIPYLMSELVDNINEDDGSYPIAKALLIHHKFEQIHPFLDGNGRTGRILFALLLTKYKVMQIPASIFSYSVYRNKAEYYKALNFADKKEYNKYLEIMINILNESLEVSISFIKQLNKKYLIIKSFEEINANKNLLILLPLCFVGVKISINYLVRKSKLNHKTIVKYLDILINLKIMKKEISGKYRPYKNLIIENLLNKYFKKIA